VNRIFVLVTAEHQERLGVMLCEERSRSPTFSVIRTGLPSVSAVSPFLNTATAETRTMLTCLPRSICSWDFRIRGTTGGEANLTFNWFTEQGTVEWNGTVYDVVKHGPFSGHWTLEWPDGVVIEAQKTSAFARRFELESDSGPITLQALSIFTRAFELLQTDSVVGTITPMHPFTRRATIQCQARVDELTQLFSFWLVVITWKRAARNNHRNT
jgi:hypothetical protein